MYDHIRKVTEVGWDDQAYLQEQYNLFLSAVQAGSDKDYRYNSNLEFVTHGSPKWGEDDTFEDWLRDTETMTKFRMHELQQRKINSSKSVPHMVGLIREAQEAGQADMAVSGIGSEMSTADYELFDFILRKSLETIILFKDGKIKLEAPESLDADDRKVSEQFKKQIMSALNRR